MSTAHDEILELLPRMWALYPDMRFGQLVVNVSYWARSVTQSATWDVEDVEFLRTLKEHLAKHEHGRGAGQATR